MHFSPEIPRVYGLMAEFDTEEALVDACHLTHEAGYTRLDAYSPYPVEEASHALGHDKSPLPLMVLIGGIVGFLSGFGLQYITSVFVYPMNVGGRPLNSWPAFIPVTFEVTILLAGITAVFGMLAINGLPRPYHPVFNVDAFRRASRDRFFLCIESRDPLYERQKTEDFLRGLAPREVSEVEN